ncbi:MAG TPA: aminoglycoside phosphotransferase family protein, partial [Pseudonocardiaceae bacterium]|nr:aminoglycoside phosphotransferase family protein [Pseudonocardiaceae bacterium]
MGEPSEQALDWASSVVGAAVTGATALREGGAPWMLAFADGGKAVLRKSWASDTEIAALRVAVEHDIRAPRLIALGDELMLVSAIAGSSRIPVTAAEHRLRALGAAAAELHAVELAPTKDLPLRHQSIELTDFTAWRRRADATPLLLAAEKAIAGRSEPPSAPVFLHGDLWQGNTMWLDDEFIAVIDWDCAGVGHPGVDLGSLRCDVAVTFGVEAADVVLEGWQERAGRAAHAMPYWDVVAALSTPP